MDKIKSVLSGNKSDQTENTNPHSSNSHGLGGEGTHLAEALDSSHMPGAFPSDQSTATGTAASTLPGQNTSTGLGSNSAGSDYNTTQGSGAITTSGPHSSNLANKADPRVDSDNSRTQGATGTSGLGSSGTVPDATAAQYTSGTDVGSKGALGLHSPFHQGAGQDTPTTTGTSGVDQSSGSHLGRDAAAVGAAGVAGEEIHRHHQQQSNVAPVAGQTGIGSSGQSYADPSVAGTTQGTQHHLHHAGPSISDTNTSSGNTLGRDPTLDQSSTGRSFPLQQGSGTTSTSQHDSHLGRDAAAVGAAGAVGQGIHHHHQENTATTAGSQNTPTSALDSSTGPHSTATANRLDPSLQSGTTESAHHHHKHHGGGAEAADKVHGSPTTSSHHLGRDAAIAGGVGGAAYEADRHLGHHGTSNISGTDRGLGSTAGATGSNAVPSGTSTGAYQSTATPSSTSTSAYQSTPGQNTSSTGHHYGRDAAVAGGVGGAAYEAEKHLGSSNTAHPTGTTGSSSVGQSTSTYPATSSTVGSTSTAPQTTGLGSSTTTGTTQPTSSGPATTSSKDHHYGRDAAVAGGVAGAGYEAEKHLGSSDSGAHPGPAPTTAGPHSKDWQNKLDPRVDAKGTSDESTRDPTNTTDPTKKDSHVGRDAAVAGGVGAAGYEAAKHHDQKELEKQQKQEAKQLEKEHKQEAKQEAKQEKAAEKEAKKEHKAAVKEHEKEQKAHEKAVEKEAKKEHKAEEKAIAKEHKREEKEAAKEQKAEEKEEKKEKKGGLFSFLHRDKSKKYTKEEEDEFDRQEREYNDSQGKSHAGRDAALGGAAVGAGAVAAEEHHKHNQQAGSSNVGAIEGAPRDSGFGTIAPGEKAVTGEYTGATPLSEKPVGKDLGDHLHGADRNRGVSGTSGIPGTEGYGSGTQTGSTSHHHYGRDAAAVGGVAGAGALAHHEHDKHDNVGAQQSGVVSSSQTGTSGTGYQPTDSQNRQGHSHLGRDAAGVGAAGAVAEHEHRKHQYPDTTQQGHSHAGRDAAGVGAAGAVAEHEHKKHEHHHGHGHHQQQGTGIMDRGHPLSSSSGAYSGTETGISEASTDQDGNPIGGSSSGMVHGASTTHGAYHTSEGRNKLHKDPPASHPAAQAGSGSHVPASGAERERMVAGGQENLGHETGVRNADPNASTNY